MDRYDEVLLLLKAVDIDDPERCQEYRDGSCVERSPLGEWCLDAWGDEDATPEQNALLNEWRELV